MRVVLVLIVIAAVALAWWAPTERGEVPDLVGRGECSAIDDLERRGLRWRFGDAPIGGQPNACVSGEPLSVADDVLAQEPREGTELEDGAVVELVTACVEEPGCARGRYAYGLP